MVTGRPKASGQPVCQRSVKSGDMALIPDLSTGVVDPFWDVPAVSFICSVVEADTKTLYFRDPRVIAQRAETYLRETRIADESRSTHTSQWQPC